MAELKYDASFPQQAREYAEHGMNNAEIAKHLNISQDTFYVYVRRFPEFADAVETGRQIIADNAGGSLMDLATGRRYVTTSGCDAGGRETRTIRQKAPDVKAIIKWLERNRQYADDGGADDFADVQGSEAADMPVPANMRYERSFPEEVEFHAANGDTDDKISRRMNISPATFYNYKKQFPAFAAALVRGRRECYGRLRCRLLALALGECGITTETVRDGRTRKTVERLLPPNLTAIKYWLADGCPAGYAGRTGETTSARPPSKVSESAENTGRFGNTENTENTGNAGRNWTGGGLPTARTETGKPQTVSKVSECGEREKSGKQEKMKAGTNEPDSAQRASKVSEPAGNTGRYEKYGMYGIGGGRPPKQQPPMLKHPLKSRSQLWTHIFPDLPVFPVSVPSKLNDTLKCRARSAGGC